MNLDEFVKENATQVDKGKFLQAFNDPRTRERMAYFEHEGICYTAVAPSENVRFGPLFALCGFGIKRFEATTNYDAPSAGELGAMALHGATHVFYKPSHGTSRSIKSKIFKQTRIGAQIKEKLRATYQVPATTSPIVSDIQSVSASVKVQGGRYETCGMRTVHRLYMATAFTILRKLHGYGSRDGVVALVADKHGRIISWGRKNPNVSCWHGETSAVMALGGKLPAGSCVYSTLKPCKMCAGLIHDASNGDAMVFWGQDDPGSMAMATKLDETAKGKLLDGNKTFNGARAILLMDGENSKPMTQELDQKFRAQELRSTIDYITTREAKVIIKQAESFLKGKYQKYAIGAPDNFNENTAFVVRHLMDFLGQIGLQPDSLGV